MVSTFVKDMNPKSKTDSIERGDQIPRDAICTCKSCHHDFFRDCVKSSCTCCVEDEHSMILDGIEGFPSLRPESYFGEASKIRNEDLIKAMKVKGSLTDSLYQNKIKK